MTQAYAVKLLRELRDLDRLIAVVQAQLMDPTAAPEWRAGLVALDDKRRWLAYCLSLEDPRLIAAAWDSLHAHEPAPLQLTPASPQLSAPLSPDVPFGRVH